MLSCCVSPGGSGFIRYTASRSAESLTHKAVPAMMEWKCIILAAGTRRKIQPRSYQESAPRIFIWRRRLPRLTNMAIKRSPFLVLSNLGSHFDISNVSLMGKYM